MRQFNAPPGWPEPPNARWRPPKDWGPAESWPPAPAGWAFWVDADGRPVRGPIGRYGGPSLLKLGAVAAVVLTLIGLVLFNPFTGGDDAGSTAAPTIGGEATPAPEPTAPSTEVPTTTGPTEARTSEPTRTPTHTPSETPSETPTSRPSTPESSTPSEPTSAPTTTTAAVVYQNCGEVRAAGKAPLHRGDPGYTTELDRNGDGTACERGNS